MIHSEITPLINEIFSSDRSEIEKLSSAFHLIAGFEIEQSKIECELLRATGDKEALIREQIKSSTIGHMLKVYADCYYRATGHQFQEEGING
jgi:hypothetical protein